jgi:type IV secretion system protein VirB11
MSQPDPDTAASRLAEMMSRFLGPTIMAAFGDDDITEIYTNPSDYRVRFDTRSRGRVVAEERIHPPQITQFLNVVATSVGVALTPENPSLKAELPNTTFRRARLQGFIPPRAEGPTFTLRKPPSQVYSLDQLVELGTLSPDQRGILRRAVRDGWNILVVGPMNSGKSTLCNGIIDEIERECPHERLVILEDTRELQCSADDYLALRAPPGDAFTELAKETLRTSAERIVIGEVRGREALDLIDAWSTGHDGGCGTLHGSSPEGALERIDRLAMRNGVPSQAWAIAEAVDLIVMIHRQGRVRRVTTLAHVAGLTNDGRYILHRLGDGANPGGIG